MKKFSFDYLRQSKTICMNFVEKDCSHFHQLILIRKSKDFFSSRSKQRIYLIRQTNRIVCPLFHQLLWSDKYELMTPCHSLHFIHPNPIMNHGIEEDEEEKKTFAFTVSSLIINIHLTSFSFSLSKQDNSLGIRLIRSY